jgi:hypothetical protein
MKFIYRFKNELSGEMTEECFAIPNIGRAPLKDQARFSSGTTQYCGIRGAVIHMRAEFIAVRSTFARVPTFHKRRARIAASDFGFSGVNGEIDPSFVVTHSMRLDEAPRGYDLFLNKQDDCVKVVLKPHT